MITNYYTLRLIALDFNRRLAGCTISQIFTQHRDELVVSCQSDNAVGHIAISCEAARNYIVLRDEFPRAKKNSLDLFQDIIAAHLQEVQMHPSDRQIILRTDAPYRMVIQLYGSKANTLLVDSDSIIRDAFLKPKEHVGKSLDERPPAMTINSLSDFHTRLQSGEERLATAIKRCFPQFGSEIVNELLYRTSLRADSISSTLTQQDIERLFEMSMILQKQLMDEASPRIYFEGKTATAFSIIPLESLSNLRSVEYDSVHTAIRTFLSASRKHKGFQEQRQQLKEFLQLTINKAERTLAKIVEEEESLTRAALFETMGKLLMANLTSLSKGMKQVELENIFSQSRELHTIQLEQGLPPAKNAARYFEKAKKIRHSIKEHFERKAGLEQRAATARDLLQKLEQVDEPESYKEFTNVHSDQFASLGLKLEGVSKTKHHEEVPFRVFTVAGGFQVWAGKSSKNNDLLTMKYAKPNDLWFHARGASGSHVVLKVGTGKGAPSKQAIQQAVNIAAYYSKMKNAKLVPVAMTERKYVRKPKGAPAGTVTLEREKTLFAEPQLPGQ